MYSPTIWPLTVSLSLGLSLFRSSLWSVERCQKEEVKTVKKAKEGREREKERRNIMRQTGNERKDERKRRGFISVRQMHVN